MPVIKWFLVVVLVSACMPSQRDPARYGTRSVHVVTGDGVPNAFAASYLAAFDDALRDAEALGPAFVRVADRSRADLTFEHFDSGPGCAMGAGQFTVGTSLARVDPVCTQGLLVLRAAIVHELGHWLGLRHVCRQPGEVADCSPVGFGPAVMNPALTYGDGAGPTLDTAYVGPVPSFQPTELDLAEFRRAHP